jgi:hypothetical protein
MNRSTNQGKNFYLPIESSTIYESLPENYPKKEAHFQLGDLINDRKNQLPDIKVNPKKLRNG